MTITAPENTTAAITVEDEDAAKSLPVGIILVDDEGDTFEKIDAELDRYRLTFCEKNGGYTSETNWESYDIVFPAIVQNPEVLFTPLSSNSDVEPGDRVRVITPTFDGGEHYLKTGTVKNTRTYIGVALDDGSIDELLCEPGELELITDEANETTPEDPYAVDNLLQVTKTVGGHGFSIGDVVRVLFDDGLYLLATTTDLRPEGLEGKSLYPGSTFDGRESVWELGVTAWLDRENSEPYVTVGDVVEEIPSRLKVGDRVRIAPSYSLSDFRGLTAKVIGLGDWGPDDVHIEPESDRPDGFERSPFHIYSYNLEPVADEVEETLPGVIRDPFELDPLPIGTVIQSTDGRYLAVKGIEGTWLNPAATDPSNFLWTALAGLGAASVGVEVLFQPVAA